MRKLLAIATAALCMAQPASAANWCSERVTGVIWGDRDLFFTTAKSCPNWCSLLHTAVSTEGIDRIYGMLLTAVALQRELGFHWNEAATLCAVVPTYSAPSNVVLHG